MRIPSNRLDRSADKSQQADRNVDMHKELAACLARTDREKPKHSKRRAKPQWNKRGGMLRARAEITGKTKSDQKNCKDQRYLCQTEPLPEADVKDISLMDALTGRADARKLLNLPLNSGRSALREGLYLVQRGHSGVAGKGREKRPMSPAKLQRIFGRFTGQ